MTSPATEYLPHSVSHRQTNLPAHNPQATVQTDALGYPVNRLGEHPWLRWRQQLAGLLETCQPSCRPTEALVLISECFDDGAVAGNNTAREQWRQGHAPGDRRAVKELITREHAQRRQRWTEHIAATIPAAGERIVKLFLAAWDDGAMHGYAETHDFEMARRDPAYRPPIDLRTADLRWKLAYDPQIGYTLLHWQQGLWLPVADYPLHAPVIAAKAVNLANGAARPG